MAEQRMFVGTRANNPDCASMSKSKKAPHLYRTSIRTQKEEMHLLATSPFQASVSIMRGWSLVEETRACAPSARGCRWFAGHARRGLGNQVAHQRRCFLMTRKVPRRPQHASQTGKVLLHWLATPVDGGSCRGHLFAALETMSSFGTRQQLPADQARVSGAASAKGNGRSLVEWLYRWSPLAHSVRCEK